MIRSFVTDHFPVFLVFAGNLPVDSDSHLISKKRYLNDTYSKEVFTTYLSRRAWNEVYETKDVDQAFELFCGRLYYLFNLCFPVRVRRVRKLDQIKPYISDEIKALIKERRRLQRLYSKYPITYSVPFKRCRNRVVSLIKQAKRLFYSKECNFENVRKSWKTVNRLLGRDMKKTLPSYIENDNTQMYDDRNIAASFNEHFASVGRCLASSLTENIDKAEISSFISHHDSIFEFNEITLEELQSAVRSMKNVSPGDDEFPVGLIKCNMNLGLPVLCSLFNLSLAKGVFPDILKSAKIATVHKGGSPYHKDNYRPVSVLKCLSSIFEKLVYDRLRVYLDCHKMLCNSQFGFRSGRSTEGALQAAVLSVYGALDSGSVALCVFLDLSKAFDRLNRDVLILKLSKYGIINS